MARKLFERQAIRRRTGALASGVAMVVYTDAAGLLPADISTSVGGSAIPGSIITSADIAGLGPAALRFYGPPDGTDTLYIRVPADTSLGVQEIEAATDPRLDALEAGSASGIPGTIMDAKGDLLAASADNTPLRLAVGADGHELISDSSTSTGLYWAAPTYINVRRAPIYAAGDGVADDATEIQSAINVAAATAGGQGGVVYLPKGVYLINSQLVLKNKVRLMGDGRSATIIKAGGSFPTSTPLIRLGDGSSIVFSCRIEYLTVDCNSVAGSTGVYSTEAQEESGVFWSTIERPAAYGVDYALGCQNCGVSDCEIYPLNGATSGLRTNATGQVYAERCTITEYAGSGSITNGIEAVGGTLTVRNIHVERTTNGVYYKNGVNGVVQTLVGHSSVTNLFRADATTNHYILLDIALNGGTNLILDDYMGTGPITSALCRFYTSHEIRLADVLLRGLGSTVTVTGSLKTTSNVGFNNTTPIAKPTVTGSRGANAALASLLTALASYGLITDSSS